MRNYFLRHFSLDSLCLLIEKLDGCQVWKSLKSLHSFAMIIINIRHEWDSHNCLTCLFMCIIIILSVWELYAALKLLIYTEESRARVWTKNEDNPCIVIMNNKDYFLSLFTFHVSLFNLSSRKFDSLHGENKAISIVRFYVLI